jgi:hypothetical protein
MSPPGGEADDTVINTGGIEELPVNDGGAIGTTLNNGGILEVFNIVPGAGGTIVNSGGYEVVNGGRSSYWLPRNGVPSSTPAVPN